VQKIVGIGDVVLGYPGDTLAIYGLGSCIALVIYDPELKVGCMLHVLLPNSPNDFIIKDTRYANEGFGRMLNFLKFAGAKKSNLLAKMVGGTSSIISRGSISEIGKRNELSCRRLLNENDIKIVGEDCGGLKSRSVVFSVSDMKFTIRCDNQLSKVI
jgi:chemotaxis protein CheD